MVSLLMTCATELVCVSSNGAACVTVTVSDTAPNLRAIGMLSLCCASR